MNLQQHKISKKTTQICVKGRVLAEGYKKVRGDVLVGCANGGTGLEKGGIDFSTSRVWMEEVREDLSLLFLSGKKPLTGVRKSGSKRVQVGRLGKASGGERGKN